MEKLKSHRALRVLAVTLVASTCATLWLRRADSERGTSNHKDGSSPQTATAPAKVGTNQQQANSFTTDIDEMRVDSSATVPGTTVPTTSSDTSVYSKHSNHLLARFENGRWVSQGDILIAEKMLKPGVGDSEAGIVELRGIHYWKNGIIPYEFDEALDASPVALAMAELDDKTSVKFVKHTGEGDFVYFTSADQDVCQSHLGRQGGRQEVVLHSSCSHGQILHELMHTLGFVHEHSREDRDQFVNIEWTNIETAQKNQFQKIPAQISIPVAIDFDFKSILLYPVTAFSINGKFTITKKDGSAFFVNRKHLSDLDVRRVNMLYGHRVGIRD